MSKHFLSKTSFKNLVQDLPADLLEKTQWFKVGEQETPFFDFLGQKLTEFEQDVDRVKKFDSDNELRPEVKRQKQTEQLKKAEVNVLKGLSEAKSGIDKAVTHYEQKFTKPALERKRLALEGSKTEIGQLMKLLKEQEARRILGDIQDGRQKILVEKSKEADLEFLEAIKNAPIPMMGVNQEQLGGLIKEARIRREYDFGQDIEEFQILDRYKNMAEILHSKVDTATMQVESRISGTKFV